jgi:hypothetical protein
VHKVSKSDLSQSWFWPALLPSSSYAISQGYAFYLQPWNWTETRNWIQTPELKQIFFLPLYSGKFMIRAFLGVNSWSGSRIDGAVTHNTWLVIYGSCHSNSQARDFLSVIVKYLANLMQKKTSFVIFIAFYLKWKR